MNYAIRSEESKDIEQVRGILCASFASDAESRLVDLLRANGKATISLVAVTDEKVLGHILFSPVSISLPGGAPPSVDTKGIGLAPVVVRRDVQAHGIGSRLIRAGLRLCQELGFDYCVVLGSPGYYQRFGFEKASRFGIENEYRVDNEFMVLRFTDCQLTGVVRYAPEFAMFAV